MVNESLRLLRVVLLGMNNEQAFVLQEDKSEAKTIAAYKAYETHDRRRRRDSVLKPHKWIVD